MNQSDFLYPHSRYRGEFSATNPASLVFNANLQEFAQKVGYISNLETGGKISPDDAYHQIETLWEQLKRSKETI